MNLPQTVAILGRQPALGLAELESLFGEAALQPLGATAALLDIAPTDFPMTRLGSTIKAAKLLTYLPFTDWEKIERYLEEELPRHTRFLAPGKVRLGLSTYGLKVNIKRQNATGLTLKKVVRNPPEGEGRSVRVVPNVSNELNTAQVTHNQLTGPTGLELVLIHDGSRTVLAQTVAVQDIEAYAARDQKRPKRDARVGMLPPKLAQILINLAVSDADPKYGGVLLDPFCGTGVILQEASLMGFDIAGSDLDERMVGYTAGNLQWLARQPGSNIIPQSEDELFCKLDVGDATSFNWKPIPNFIACETYLGRPFSSEPTPEKLREVLQDVNTIHKKFLRNVARQTKPGFRMCIAVPAWKSGSGFRHLPTLDSLEDLGYTRVSFAHVRDEDLVYHRPGQIVARELVVLTRK
ncbi:MAG TPA: hypothetical protein VK674_01450 [Candidatus Limnocylindria bacterium]|nr:hypothetical protein [Candidatus Limnocylindria bacterium]